MSASREKRKRQESKSDTPVMSAKEKQQRKDKFRRRIAIAVATVVLLAIIGLIFTASGIPQANFTAVSVNDVKVTAAEYNYYYYLNYYQFLTSQNGQIYIQYGLFDPNTPLHKQEYSEDMSWADYFKEQAALTAQNYVALSEQAKAEGMTLTQEEKDIIEEGIAALESAAAEMDLSADEYLRQNYGRGLSIDNYRAIAERRSLAISYQRKTLESFDRSDEAVTAYYNENKDTYDKIDYHIFSFDLTPPARGEGEEPYTDEETEAFKAEQKTKAEEMLSRVTTGDAFKELSLEYTEPEETDGTTDEDSTDEDSTDEDSAGEDSTEGDETDEDEEETDSTFISLTASSVTTGVLADYMLHEDRKEGDKALLEDETKLHVVLYLRRWRDEEKTVNVRHILISLGEYEDNAAAKAKAEEVYQEWKDGAATEDSFAELARINSADANNYEGGLYENVYKGQMVEPFETWCFDPARKVGDTGIVETVHGFHVMYYSGDGDAKWAADSKSDMDEEEYKEWITNHLLSYPYKTSWFGMMFAGFSGVNLNNA